MTQKVLPPGASPVTLLKSSERHPSPKTVSGEVRRARRSHVSNRASTDETQEIVPIQHLVGDRFFRQMVQCMRNGVLAITRDGRIAVMNEVAYRVFGLEPSE